MQKKQKLRLFIIVSIIILFAVNYFWINSILINWFEGNSEAGVVKRIVDGDTVIVSGQSVRMLGINTPERGELFYQEAKENLEEYVNKTIKLEFGKNKKDRYNRTLAYVFFMNENLNLKQVKEGFANPYFPSGKHEYYYEFYSAWNGCKENICENSEQLCAGCIKLIELDKWNQEVAFENVCSFSCSLSGWTIKDEGRKQFEFPKGFILDSKRNVLIKVGEGQDAANILYWKSETYVWTASGDAIFLRDNENRLVLWEKY